MHPRDATMPRDRSAPPAQPAGGAASFHAAGPRTGSGEGASHFKAAIGPAAVRLALGLFGGAVLAATALRNLASPGNRGRLARQLLAGERGVAFVANASTGRILAATGPARTRFGTPATLDALLGFFPGEKGAAPLASDLRRTGTALAIISTLEGPAELRAQALPGDLALWRLGAPIEAPPDLPILDLDPSGALRPVNDDGRRLFGTGTAALGDVLLDPPLAPGRVHRFATPSGHVERQVVELPGPAGHRRFLLLPPQVADPRGIAEDGIEALPLPLLRVAPDGAILSANRPARALLPRPVTPGTRLSDLLEGLGRPLAEWVADVAAGRPSGGPQFLRGTGPHQDTTLRMSLSAAGHPGDPHLIAVLDDVTELKAIEAQFVQSQKMQALGQLAGGVAHDFNNLLTAITGHCDLLLLRHDAPDADPADRADLLQIRRNVDRAASLVGQLLAFSRKQSMLPETLDLRVVLSDLTDLLNRLVGERVRLELDHDPSLGFVRTDKRQLEQVIMNLVVNARDAMPNGGDIRIETGNHLLAEPLTLGRATVPPGRYVLVKVRDEGTGIPPERLPKIFEPFYTTKKPGEGTGLGLSTVYGIVKQSGGYIFADSEVGRGSVFTLWFPAHDRPAAVPPIAEQAEPQRDPSPASVLLVEDEAPVRAFAARALRLRGHTVHEADCAAAALAFMADPAVRVDLILSDVILPDMDGPTWVKAALAHRPATRVVFASGYAEESFAEQKSLIAGASFLPKPFSLADLTALVERRLAEPVEG